MCRHTNVERCESEVREQDPRYCNNVRVKEIKEAIWRGSGHEEKRKGKTTRGRERARFKGVLDARVNSPFSRGWATLPLSLGRKIGALRVGMYRYAVCVVPQETGLSLGIVGAPPSLVLTVPVRISGTRTRRAQRVGIRHMVHEGP